MPHDPDEAFDSTVLDLIEASPTGAVPATPFYQDAIRRLLAVHHIFRSADQRDGYVTARSLAGRPCFRASNLADLAAGRIDSADLEPNGAIFERYLAFLPEARRAAAAARRLDVAGRPIHHRRHAGDVHDPVHSLFLVPGAGPHPGLPGNYLHGSVYETGSGDAWAVAVHDSDDGAALIDIPSRGDAIAKVEELVSCAPFGLAELEALGFRML